MKKIQIQVPEPCSENWLLMSPAEKGRYCNSCQKVVIDFSIMSDQEIIQYFQKYSGNTCGNFGVSQLNRDIREPATPIRKKYWGMLFSVLITFFASCKSGVEKLKGKIITDNSQTYTADPFIVGYIVMMPEIDSVIAPGTVTSSIDSIVNTKAEVELLVSKPILKQNTDSNLVDSMINTTITITGKVMNDQGGHLPGAMIHIEELDKKFITDADGSYSISLQQPGKFTFVTSYVGYETIKINVEAIPNHTVNIVLPYSENELTGVVVVGYPAIRGRSIIACRVVGIRKESIARQIADTVKYIFPSSLSVFPNPVSKGSFVQIKLNLVSDFDLLLIDNNGRHILKEYFTFSSKNEMHRLQLPSRVAAGIYFVKVIDKHSKKQYTSKLIVR